MSNILLTTPNLSELGGVSNFLNSMLLSFRRFNDITFRPLEIGGHGKNIFGFFSDQWNFNYALKHHTINLAFINPSLLIKSFFRDGMFAKQLVKQGIPFIVFFHGWDLEFEKRVDKSFVDFFLNSFGQAERIFVLSADFRDKILEWGYRGKIIVETTMVDSSLVESLPTQKESDRIKLLFLSRIIKEKGVFETLEAFERVSKKRGGVELIIAGDGEDFKELKERASKINNVRVVGYVEGESKRELFRESDIYCLPTNYGEGLPVSVLEAMFYGLPIVTTKMGGLRGFFKDKKMGYFVEPEDVEGLEQKIEALILDSENRKRIGEFNTQYAQEHLTDSVVTDRIYTHIKEVLC
jgi:glycosyltransferase involved in cell wall biosynthesis